MAMKAKAKYKCILISTKTGAPVELTCEWAESDSTARSPWKHTEQVSQYVTVTVMMGDTDRATDCPLCVQTKAGMVPSATHASRFTTT
jgi:hypothetical protein